MVLHKSEEQGDNRVFLHPGDAGVLSRTYELTLSLPSVSRDTQATQRGTAGFLVAVGKKGLENEDKKA